VPEVGSVRTAPPISSMRAASADAVARGRQRARHVIGHVAEAPVDRAQRLLARKLAEQRLYPFHLPAQELELAVVAGAGGTIDHRRQALELGAQRGGLPGRGGRARRTLDLALQRRELAAKLAVHLRGHLALQLLAQRLHLGGQERARRVVTDGIGRPRFRARAGAMLRLLSEAAAMVLMPVVGHAVAEPAF
jgi:hypothetical protein